jgi:hypothetical protein
MASFCAAFIISCVAYVRSPCWDQLYRITPGSGSNGRQGADQGGSLYFIIGNMPAFKTMYPDHGDGGGYGRPTPTSLEYLIISYSVETKIAMNDICAQNSHNSPRQSSAFPKNSKSANLFNSLNLSVTFLQTHVQKWLERDLGSPFWWGCPSLWSIETPDKYHS